MLWEHTSVVICSKFITFVVTKTTHVLSAWGLEELWFAQNSLPLRWQRQQCPEQRINKKSCDLLKIHYLCGDKDNPILIENWRQYVVICSKFITFVVTKTTEPRCGRAYLWLWFAQNSLPLWWQRQHNGTGRRRTESCDLLKIHYLCGDKDNTSVLGTESEPVVICSKFITFVVTKTTLCFLWRCKRKLWFAQNSLPLWWQRQRGPRAEPSTNSCDLLKIHYLCGDKDNNKLKWECNSEVVICSKFITFVVTKTTNRII